MREAEDELIRQFADRLQQRKLFKCIDIRAQIQHEIDPETKKTPDHLEQIDKCYENVLFKLQSLAGKKKEAGCVPAILTDEGERSPYKTSAGSTGPVDQINVRTESGPPIDLKRRSDVVANLRDFKFERAYFDQDDSEAEKEILFAIDKEITKCR